MKAWMKMVVCASLLAPAGAVRADGKKTDTVETASGVRTTTQGEMGDRAFIERAASSNLAEVQLGRLAVEKGTSPTVKALGQRMIDDHTKANDALKAVAVKISVPLPTETDTRSKATYDKLSKLSGASFDKAYVDAVAKGHDEDVQTFKRELGTTGIDPDVKAWAQKTLVVVQAHDQMAHQDKDALKK
jgi:putative membrane protein